MIVALLLKHVGYVGHIINLDIHIYLTDEEKMLELTVKNHTSDTRLMDEILQATQSQGEGKFNIAKAAIREHIKNNKLTDLIRII